MLEDYTWYDIGVYYELSYKPDQLPFVMITNGGELPDIATFRPEGSAWSRSPAGWYNLLWERSFIPNPIAFMKLPRFDKSE